MEDMPSLCLLLLPLQLHATPYLLSATAATACCYTLPATACYTLTDNAEDCSCTLLHPT